MVFPFDSFSFTLPGNQVEAGWLINSILRGGGPLAGLLGGRSSGHRSPLAIGDVHQFAEQDLVLTRDDNVLLRELELG